MLPTIEEFGHLKKLSCHLSSFTFNFENTSNAKQLNTFNTKQKEEFEQRLKSYKVGLWAIPEISPLHCAQYGWYLLDSEMLHCASCKKFICTKLPSNNMMEAYSAFLNQLKIRIHNGHYDSCEFRNHACPVEFIQPSFQLSDLKKLSSSSQKLCEIDKGLPLIKTSKILAKLNLNEYHLSVLFKLGEPLDEIKITSSLLALCGWTFEHKNSLKCRLCLRSVGLWNFFMLKEDVASQKYERAFLKRLRKKHKEEMLNKAIEEKKKNEEILCEMNKSLEKKEREKKETNFEEMGFVELENTIEDIFEEDSLLSDNKDENPERQTLSIKESISISTGPNTDLTKKNRQGSTTLLPSDELEPINDPVLGSVDSGCFKSIKGNKATSDCFSEEDISSNNSNDDLWAEALRSNKQDISKSSSLNSLPSETNAEDVVNDSSSASSSEAFPSHVTESSEIVSLDCQEALQANAISRKRHRSESDEDDCQIPNKIQKKPSSTNPVPNNVSITEKMEAQYLQVESEEDSDESEQESETRKLFDPLAEHRHWCGWLWEADQNGSKVPGYLLIPPQLKALTPNSPLTTLSKSSKYAKNIEGLRAIRTFLEDCTLPSDETLLVDDHQLES